MRPETWREEGTDAGNEEMRTRESRIRKKQEREKERKNMVRQRARDSERRRYEDDN